MGDRCQWYVSQTAPKIGKSGAVMSGIALTTYTMDTQIGLGCQNVRSMSRYADCGMVFPGF